MLIVKKIFRYLKGTKGYVLWYPLKGNFEVSVFIDVDKAGNIDDRKSMSGSAFFLGGRLVAWANKK